MAHFVLWHVRKGLCAFYDETLKALDAQTIHNLFTSTYDTGISI